MNIQTLVKYVLTPFVSFISLVLTLYIWLAINPFLFSLIMKIRGDGMFWSLFGKWGELFIWIIISALSLQIFILLGMFIGGLVKKLSPNKTFTLYNYILWTIIIMIYTVFVICNDIEFTFFEIVRSLINIGFMLFICFGIGNTAIND